MGRRRKHPRQESPTPAPEPQAAWSADPRQAIALAIAAALAVACYANAPANGFALDDIGIIVENPVVRNGAGLGTIFTSPYWPVGASGVSADPTLYRPLTILSFLVDAALWGPRPSAFHAVNILWHVAATVLLFVTAVRVLGSLLPAFAAAALFAVHPLHTEAVTGLVGRADLMATVFVLSAFLLLRRRDSSGVTPWRLVAGASCWMLGLFAKEMAATLPALLVLDDWLHRHELPRDRPPRLQLLVGRYAALAVAAVAWLLLREQAVSGESQVWAGFVGLSPLPRVLTASRVALEYVGLFLFPVRLLADYWVTEVPIATTVLDPLVLLSLLTWLAAGALVVRVSGREPGLALGIAWFFITFAPVSNVLFPIGVAKAERLMYLPSVGLCFVAAWGLDRLQRLVRPPLAVRLAVMAIIAVLGARTLVRNRDWKDSLTLALATLRESPASPLMNDIAAGEYMKRGDAAAALPLLRAAVQSAPGMAFIRTHLGTVYGSLGQLDSAVAQYTEALRLNPSDSDAHNNIGVALMSGGRVEEAIPHFRAAIGIRPTFPDPHMNLGVLFLGRGALDSALARVVEAVRLNPASAEGHNNLGVVLQRVGQLDRAAAEYREALRLNPNHAKARENLAALVSGAPPR